MRFEMNLAHHSQEPPILSVEKLSAWFAGHHAVKEVSMDVNRNTVVAIIGPSGCGKSTFIRCINRLHEEIPQARAKGTVLLEGENIYSSGVDPVTVRRKIGMVFQKPNPFP